MKKFVENLSVREKQVYGALCLAAFCENKGIYHLYIDKLLEHLLRLMTADNLVEWDKESENLEFDGRGDPVPKELEDEIPVVIRQYFQDLINAVVEIGLADMYGASTEEPTESLVECLNILNVCGVPVPEVEGIFLTRVDKLNKTNWWGEPLPESIVEKVKNMLLMIKGV